MNTPLILASEENGIGRLTLNRPKALHALTTEMCQQMIDVLLRWRNDSAIVAVLLDHSGERGFCAGGDIRAIAASGAADGAEARAFFHLEYRLNALLFSYPKPRMAIMDGVVMGGGAGLAGPCPYRIATERTLFAMPETAIGLFPDVGGGWRLPRMPGKTGYWLALTGARIRAGDCIDLGVATHFVSTARLDEFKRDLIARPTEWDSITSKFNADPGDAPLRSDRMELDRTFAAESVESVLDALRIAKSPWATAQLEALQARSPQSMKVSMQLLLRGADMASFNHNMVMEYRIAGRIVQTHDFQEGVRALIVDKDNAPRWRPDTLAGVTDAQINALFAPLPPDEEWSPLD